MKRGLLFLSLLGAHFSFAQSVDPIYSHDFTGTLTASNFSISTTGVSLTSNRFNEAQSAALLTSTHGLLTIDIDPNDKDELMEEGTITMWFKYAGQGASAFGNDKPLVYWSNGNPSYSEGVFMSVSTNAYLRVISYQQSGVGGTNINSPSSQSMSISNTWHHFAVSWKFGEGGFIKGYFDGVEIVSRDHSFELPSTTLNSIVLTGFNSDFPSSLYGAIDDIRVYKKALPQAEIHHIYDPCVVNIPDANFKTALLNYTTVIDTNGDGEIQCYEAAAKTGLLSLSNKNIADLTGIAAFVNITNLICGNNQLTNLDISSNVSLTSLSCHNNQLTSLDVSDNENLERLYCDNNQLTSLDISSNPAITELSCRSNQLTSLNVANGNNTDLILLQADINNNLFCIEVDNATYSNTNWTFENNYYKPSWAVWSEDCTTLGIAELEKTQLLVYPNPVSSILHVTVNEKTQITIVDLLGAEVMTTVLSNQENTIDVSSLTSGVYFIQTEGGVKTKFIRE